MRLADLPTLVCSRCHEDLEWEGTNLEGILQDGTLACEICDVTWKVIDGFPRMFSEEDLRSTDRRIRILHDSLPRAHKPALKIALPLLGAGREQLLREAFLSALGPLEEPVRLLEIGIGEGANLPQLQRVLPEGSEIWGIDTSTGLLDLCRSRWAGALFVEDARLVAADAHRLPFSDDTFDRILHVGGLGRFDDSQQVLEEILRVARPGARVVLVCKSLDPDHPHPVWVQSAFRLWTFYDPTPGPPIAWLSDRVENLRNDRINRFYTCAHFSAP
jgi:ubiquinone/menaquinone biosynthesis C-methylase UbiE/uncharacterized protein YbaR (Trm112 family)